MSSLGYADRLSHCDDLGQLGTPELFDGGPADSDPKVLRLIELVRAAKARNSIIIIIINIIIRRLSLQLRARLASLPLKHLRVGEHARLKLQKMQYSALGIVRRRFQRRRIASLKNIFPACDEIYSINVECFNAAYALARGAVAACNVARP